MALTLVLLAGAGLLVASFIRMVTMPRGFDERNLGWASFEFPHYGDSQRRAFFDQLTARIAAIPSVRGATPGMSPVGGYSEKFLLEQSDGPQPVAVSAESFPVGADYFRVAGIALKEGRTFGPQDGPNAPRVAIISENAARRFWPGQSPIGRHFRLDRHDAPFTVVGVVAHITTIQLTSVGMEIYLPVEQFGWSPELLFRVTGNPALAIAAMWLSRLLASQLFQVKPYDPATFAAVLVLFLGVSVVAVAVPMRRATHVDPAEALRAE